MRGAKQSWFPETSLSVNQDRLGPKLIVAITPRTRDSAVTISCELYMTLDQGIATGPSFMRQVKCSRVLDGVGGFLECEEMGRNPGGSEAQRGATGVER